MTADRTGDDGAGRTAPAATATGAPGAARGTGTTADAGVAEDTGVAGVAEVAGGPVGVADADADADADERTRLLARLAELVEPLHATIPGGNEVVLHDLSALPNSVVAIAGDVTGRSVGSPATDRLLRAVAHGEVETTVAYDSRLPGGRELRSTTMICRDSAGTPVAALCINVDVTMWRAIHELASSMLPARPIAPSGAAEDGETFLGDIDGLAQHLLSQAIASCGAPVELMQKRHKLAVVEDLKDRGFFLLKESVETAAQALGVTRFTIYNYLNELEADGR